MVVAGAYIGTRWRMENFCQTIRSFAILVLFNAVAESVKTLALGAFGVPGAGAYLVGQTYNPVSNLFDIWANSVEGLILTYDGLLATAITLGLALLYVLSQRGVNDLQRLLLTWVLVASGPYALLTGYFQTRIIYDLPIPVLASGGLLILLSKMAPGSASRVGLLLSVVLMSASYGLHSMLIF